MTTREKKCPMCGHPMMQGPLRKRTKVNGIDADRIADWWCADCHHTIWQPLVVNPKPLAIRPRGDDQGCP